MGTSNVDDYVVTCSIDGSVVNSVNCSAVTYWIDGSC